MSLLLHITRSMGIARAVCASHRAGLRTKYHVVVAGLAVLLAVPQAVAAQTEIDLLVYRSQTSIDLFVRAPADDMSQLLGSLPHPLLDADARINFDYVKEQSWTIAQTLWQRSDIRLGDQRLDLEATSFVLHPKDDPLAFETPMDAMSAISFCTVPRPDRPLFLERMDAYMGFIGFVTDPQATLQMVFTRQTDVPILFNVLDYTDGTLTASQKIEVLPGRALVLRAGAQRRVRVMAANVSIALVAALGLSGLLTHRNRRRTRLRPS